MVPRAGETNQFPLVGPFNDSSTSSSPRPTSEIDVDLSSHQRDQDVHLAHSMRARSGTLLDREMPTPARTDRAGSVATVMRGGGAGAGGEDSMVGTRRGTLVSDHLADDLEIQVQQLAENDQLFFDRHPSSPEARPGASERQQQQQRFTPQTMHHSPALQQSAASARFYRQRRNLSDSSIDSQGGAYIDHRMQPHSLSIGSTGRGVMGSGGSGGIRMAEGYGSRSAGRTGLRREVGGDDDDNHARNNSPPSPSNRQRDETTSGISAGTIRQPLSPDHRESAIVDDDDEEEERKSHHSPYPVRQTSQNSFRSPVSRHISEPEAFSHELSRVGSLMGKPEEDVCFPAHGAADPDLIDINMNGMYTSEQSHHEAMHHAHAQAHETGVPGVLHNFPFPFDFNALEDFAEREKDGMPIPSGSRGRTTGLAGAEAAFTASPPGYGSAADESRPRMGINAGGKDDTGGRKTMRQRKFSESVAPGRFQRKLALFEGGDDPGASARPTRSRPGASILDTKTPLLSGAGASSRMGGAGGPYGPTRGPTASAPSSGAARPYRFSFYSNSLPSTIHARSLAELPAEGQTFEELFVGHQPSYEDESMPGTEPRGAFSPDSHAGTGANTPNPSFNGARPAGIAQMQAELGAKAKSRMMRTEVDAEANTWWLDVLCPTDQEMKVLSKVFGIHPLTTEDIQMEETREKIELFRNYYFVCFRSFEQDPYSPTYLEPLNMYIIVFREGTLSFHFRGTPHPQNVRRRIKQLKDYINVTSDWISYALIDDITDAFGPLIQNIEYEVDSIDDLVLILKEAEQSDMLRRIGTCRKKVMGLLRLMGNKADVVKGLSKRCNENWSVAPKSDIGLYLSDIQDHITTSTQNLTHYEKILSRSHSNYLAQISIEMTDANNQINNVLSKLTALGTVLVPMNLITGLWGMNVNVPGQFQEDLTWFFGILGAMGAIAFGGAWLAYRVFVRPT